MHDRQKFLFSLFLGHTRFAQKQMKSGLGKNGGGGKKGFFPPKDPFFYAQFLSHIAKNVFGKT